MPFSKPINPVKTPHGFDLENYKVLSKGHENWHEAEAERKEKFSEVVNAQVLCGIDHKWYVVQHLQK